MDLRLYAQIRARHIPVNTLYHVERRLIEVQGKQTMK